MVNRDDKRAQALDRSSQPLQIIQPEPGMDPRLDNLIDRPHAETRNPQQHLSRRRVDVHWELVAMAKGPGKFWVDVRIEHISLAAIEDFASRESIVAHQPIGLIQPV